MSGKEPYEKTKHYNSKYALRRLKKFIDGFLIR